VTVEERILRILSLTVTLTSGVKAEEVIDGESESGDCDEVICAG